MDITKARQSLERHKRVVSDYIKRGYIKRCEDIFVDLEKTLAALPAGDAELFRADVAAFVASTRQQLGLTWIESTKKDVQRHLKYAEDSMAKGNVRNVLSAKDVIIKTVDKSDGRSYFDYHESGAPFLAEIDAMYQKIDAWLAANDPSAKPAPSPAPQAAPPKPAAAPAPAPSVSTSPSAASTSSSSARVAATAPAPAPAASKPAPAAAPPKEPEYRRLDDGAFLPVFDTSPSTGLPKAVLNFLPSMVNSYGKNYNPIYAETVRFVDAAVSQCKTPFDIQRKAHELAEYKAHLLEKLEQVEKVIPKAQPVDDKLAKILETELAAARAKVEALVTDFEAKAKAAAPLLEVKTLVMQMNKVAQIMQENQNDTGTVRLHELSAYNSNAGVNLKNLWGIMNDILAKAKAAALQVAEVTGKPYDIATEEPDSEKALDIGVQAHVNILAASIKDHVKYDCYRDAFQDLAKIKEALEARPFEAGTDALHDLSVMVVEAQAALEFKKLEAAEGRQVPRRKWAAGDADAERLEAAALAWLADNFGDRSKPMTPLIARIVGGDWHVLKRNHLDQPTQWNVLMGVIFFEDPFKGFEEPRLRVLYVGPMCREDGSRDLPFVGATIVPTEGGEDMFLLKNLPEPFQTEIKAKFDAWEKVKEEKRQKEQAEAAAARKQAAVDRELKWREQHKEWVDEFMKPFTGGKIVASGGEDSGETWEYSADGILRCTKGHVADQDPFEWNGMHLRQVWAEGRTQGYGSGKWDRRKFAWPLPGGNSAYAYFLEDGRWKGTSYFHGSEHALSWDGKTLTADVRTLDQNKIRFDKLTVEGSVPPYVVLAVAMMGCLRLSSYEVQRKMWEKAKKEEEQRKMSAILEIRLSKPYISERNMKHELMRRGFW